MVLGCPIRKSTDQVICADPRGLSQLITSFIASESLGILHAPLIHLIVLIANAHHFRLFWQTLSLSLALKGVPKRQYGHICMCRTSLIWLPFTTRPLNDAIDVFDSKT